MQHQRLPPSAAAYEKLVLGAALFVALLGACGRPACKGVTTDFQELIASRHSMRSFASRNVDEHDLARVLEAARRAPSAGNLQAYEIVVVRDAARRRRLSAAAHGQPSVAEAPVVLVFLADPRRSATRYAERGARLFAIQDATLAAAYAQLAAHALGLASVWVGAFDDGAVLDAVSSPAGLVPSSLLPIGYARSQPSPTSRRPLDELVHQETLR